MFQVLILVCAAGAPAADCQVDTALDVVRGPTVASEVLCGVQGQAYIAPTQVTPRNPGEFLKIKCMPSPKASEAVGRRVSVARRSEALRAAGSTHE